MDIGASKVVTINVTSPCQVTEIECSSCFVSTHFSLVVFFVVFRLSKIKSRCIALAGPTLTALPGMTDRHAPPRSASKCFEEAKQNQKTQLQVVWGGAMLGSFSRTL